MAVYRFRVSFEEFDDVYRDIEIRSMQTFEVFHNAIQDAIGFDNSKPASFYMSNDQWKKGQEINNFSSNNKKVEAMEMKDCALADFIADPHQKIYYVFDFPSQWTFFIELFKILPDGEPGKKYPLCIKVHNEAPKQYVVVEAAKGLPDAGIMDDDLFNDIVMEEEEDEPEEAEANITGEVGFGEAVDEEEYDNIEESAEEEGEKE